MNIGIKLRTIRKNNKLTLKQLGELVGLSEQAIGQYERGDRNPSIDILNKIAAALGITVNDLIKDDTIDITNMNDDTEFYIDCIIERPELKPIIDIFKKYNYTLRQDIKGSDIHLIKNGIEEAYISEDDFIDFGLSMVNAINEFTEFQLNKLIDMFTMLS